MDLIINCSWINETGYLEIVIKYKPQDWFETGAIISIISFSVCVGYLFYDWKKNDKRIKIVTKNMINILKRKNE